MTGIAADVDTIPVEADWEQANAEFLSRSLGWLRERLAGSDEPWPEPAAGPTPALTLLAERFGLSAFDTAVLLLCVGTELDPGLLAGGRDPGAVHSAELPTFALAMQTLPDPSWDAVSAHRPLRYWRLVTVDRASGRPLTACAIGVDERVLNYVKGLNVLDDRLGRILRPGGDERGVLLPPSQQQAVDRIHAIWADTDPAHPLPVIELAGADERTRRQVADAAARSAGLTLYRIDTAHLVDAEMDEVVRLLDRESLLLPLAYYVEGDSPDGTDRTAIDLVSEVAGPTLYGVAQINPLAYRRARVVDVHRPTTTEQRSIWLQVLGRGHEATASAVADHFDLDPGTIHDLAAHAATRRAIEGSTLAQSVWTACCEQNRPELSTLASCITPLAEWHDLVLPADELAALHRLADQVRGRPIVLREWGLQKADGRGRGVSALFAGQPGTGKTLAAEVLARDLSLTLCRVDLSNVVSKYIGDTERNLRRVFDAAEQGGVLLFFDEADALFGRRSEVKDSHDRYANIEVNYLLQRMEDFGGIAVLATNQHQALDPAFLRRLRFVITFPYPSQVERRALWARAFPASAPTENLDLDRLADLPANGGMIRNIALNAAYCAAGGEGTVTMRLVLEMARGEFAKMGMPLSDTHFTMAEVS